MCDNITQLPRDNLTMAVTTHIITRQQSNLCKQQHVYFQTRKVSVKIFLMGYYYVMMTILFKEKMNYIRFYYKYCSITEFSP